MTRIRRVVFRALKGDWCSWTMLDYIRVLCYDFEEKIDFHDWAKEWNRRAKIVASGYTMALTWTVRIVHTDANAVTTSSKLSATAHSCAVKLRGVGISIVLERA